jgi:endoglucanase
MGEFGAYSKADMASREKWTTYVAREAERRQFSWAYWEFGAGFGVYDRAKKAFVPEIKRALIPTQ